MQRVIHFVIMNGLSILRRVHNHLKVLPFHDHQESSLAMKYAIDE